MVDLVAVVVPIGPLLWFLGNTRDGGVMDSRQLAIQHPEQKIIPVTQRSEFHPTTIVPHYHYLNFFIFGALRRWYYSTHNSITTKRNPKSSFRVFSFRRPRRIQ